MTALQMVFDIEAARLAARTDVDDQRAIDREQRRTPSFQMLECRIRAVIDAAGQHDEPHAYRQALLDAAAVMEEMAAHLPRPQRSARRLAA